MIAEQLGTSPSFLPRDLSPLFLNYHWWQSWFADQKSTPGNRTSADFEFSVRESFKEQQEKQMSKSKHSSDFSKVRAELEAKLAELNERATEIDDDLSEAPDADWDENAIDSEQDEVLEQVGKATNEEIAQIKRALAQIDAGSYGVCTKCATIIDAERLEALPFSTRCVKCS